MVCLGERNQPLEEGWSVQQPKRCEKNVNNVHDTASQQYRQSALYVVNSPCFYISFFSFSLISTVIHRGGKFHYSAGFLFFFFNYPLVFEDLFVSQNLREFSESQIL